MPCATHFPPGARFHGARIHAAVMGEHGQSTAKHLKENIIHVNIMVFLISRSHIFSPNSIQRDSAIYKAVCREFKSQGEEVACLSEEELISDPTLIQERKLYGDSCIVSMGRDVRTLRILERMEAMGSRVFNAPSALLANDRLQIDAVMNEVQLGTRSLGTTTDVAYIEKEIGYPLWIKTADTATRYADDVLYVDCREKLEEALALFAKHPGNEWVISEHVAGDLIKFYGVEGTDFFFWSYPTQKAAFSKFGKEEHNGKPLGHSFSAAALKERIDKAAEKLGLFIYGGDAIVRPDGSVAIVDFNDFPSFAACCRPAAEAIVSRVLNA